MPAPAPVAAPAPAEPTAAPPVTAPAPPVTAVPPVAFDNMVLILDIITSFLLIKILVQVRGMLFVDHLEEAECRSEQGGDGRRNLQYIRNEA